MQKKVKVVRTLIHFDPKVYIFLKYLSLVKKKDMSALVNEILLPALEANLSEEEKKILLEKGLEEGDN